MVNGEWGKLTSLAYSAALDNSKWEAFLRESSALFGGGIRTCLFGYDADARIDLGNRQFGYDPGFEKSYTDYYAEKDFIAARLLEQQEGRVVPYEEIWDRENWKKTEFYNEWVQPQQDITGGCSVLLFNQERRLFAFSGSIRAKDAQSLGKNWQRFVSYMTPHLQQAFEVARTLAGAQIEKRALVNVHDPMTAGCLVVSTDRTILFANPRAEAMLEEGSVIGHGVMRRLAFLDVQWEKRFTEALLKFRANGMNFSDPVLMVNQGSRPTMTCRIAPLYQDRLNWQTAGILFDAEEPCFLLTLSQDYQIDDLSSRLRKQFKLTPSETQVLLHLARGASTREIAEQRATSINTVRNQVQSILGKMELRRQTEVVRTVEQIRRSLF